MQIKFLVSGLFAAGFMALAPIVSFAQPFVDGIDVSKWQGTINWTSVKNDGIDFAFVKATEGVNYIDPKYHANMQGAAAAGVMVGPYHFTRIDSYDGVPFTSYDGSPFLPGSDPYLDALSEANDFLDAITPYYDTGQYLPPVADVEGLPSFGSLSLERTFISNWMQIFSDTINNALGRRPIIYTSKYGANNRFTSTIASSHDLWLAWWKDGTSNNPPVPSDTPLWDPWQFWQYTDSGTVNGIAGNVDRDVFDGTLLELQQQLIGYEPPDPGSIVMITDFESDEGYFNWPTSYSGSNVGIGASSTANRVTTEAQQGIASQEIYIDGDPSSWVYRHVSGIGSPASSPATNLALEATGHVGFWLKTTDAGMTVRIAIDDPDTADRGIAKQVVADGQWHLYEWDFSDANQWEAWVNEEGIITGPTVTIDSIQFFGAGQATFYLDSVAHNPLGSLTYEGDFDYDGDVDDDDVARWEGDFGTNAGSDFDDDGDSDGLDFLAWQRNTGSTAVIPLSQVAAIPEPTTSLLAALGAITTICLRRRQRRICN
ncbi:MAG: glycoside hydrolase family 25 protein [Planctomycetales bacterium]|nr:glycoside hydrolase family 25 protein [Planctomycetales bacterium]